MTRLIRATLTRPFSCGRSYVDERELVWLSDFGANALVSFTPRTQRFATIRLPSSPANVRQLLGRPHELWGAESGVDRLVVVRRR